MTREKSYGGCLYKIMGRVVIFVTFLVGTAIGFYVFFSRGKTIGDGSTIPIRLLSEEEYTKASKQAYALLREEDLFKDTYRNLEGQQIIGKYYLHDPKYLQNNQIISLLTISRCVFPACADKTINIPPLAYPNKQSTIIEVSFRKGIPGNKTNEMPMVDSTKEIDIPVPNPCVEAINNNIERLRKMNTTIQFKNFGDVDIYPSVEFKLRKLLYLFTAGDSYGVSESCQANPEIGCVYDLNKGKVEELILYNQTVCHR